MRTRQLLAITIIKAYKSFFWIRRQLYVYEKFIENKFSPQLY